MIPWTFKDNKYYENFMLTWVKWTNFLKTQSIKFTYEELDDLNWLISVKEIDLIIYEPKCYFSSLIHF